MQNDAFKLPLPGGRRQMQREYTVTAHRIVYIKTWEHRLRLLFPSIPDRVCRIQFFSGQWLRSSYSYFRKPLFLTLLNYYYYSTQDRNSSTVSIRLLAKSKGITVLGDPIRFLVPWSRPTVITGFDFRYIFYLSLDLFLNFHFFSVFFYCYNNAHNN